MTRLSSWGFGRTLRRALPVFLAVVLGLVTLAHAAEVIPPAPPNHFNDFAGVVPPATAQQLDRELADFERQTSNQIVVAVYRKMESPSSIDDYSVRVYQAWKIGQKGRDNGALLLVFIDDHKMRIATGYGLEGALPDATCKRILDTELTPRFRAGNFAGGLAAGVHAMMAATRGEYRGTGRTNRDAAVSGKAAAGIAQFVVVIVIALLALATRRKRGVVYGHSGRSVVSTPWWWGGPGGWGGGGGGGGWSGGGGFGGGGGFSGGGGSTGGGGASGSW